MQLFIAVTVQNSRLVEKFEVHVEMHVEVHVEIHV